MDETELADELINLCRRSRDEAEVSLELELLDMQVYHEEGDTIRAATMMGKWASTVW